MHRYILSLKDKHTLAAVAWHMLEDLILIALVLFTPIPMWMKFVLGPLFSYFVMAQIISSAKGK